MPICHKYGETYSQLVEAFEQAHSCSVETIPDGSYSWLRSNGEHVAIRAAFSEEHAGTAVVT